MMFSHTQGQTTVWKGNKEVALRFVPRYPSPMVVLGDISWSMLYIQRKEFSLMAEQGRGAEWLCRIWEGLLCSNCKIVHICA